MSDDPFAPTGRAITSAVPPKPVVLGERPQPRALHFAMLRTLDQIRALEPEWRALFECDGLPHQVFQQFDWLTLWAELYLKGSLRVAVVTGRIEGRLAFLWPLVIHHLLGLRVLTTMGEPLSQYCDAIVARDLSCSEADAALAYVTTLPADVIALRRVRDDAAIAPALRRRFGPAHGCQAAPVVNFAGSETAAAFEARYAGKLRSSRRRRRRRLDEHGPVTIQSMALSREAAAHVATALTFKRAWARRHGVVAPAIRDPRFERFFVAAAHACRTGADLRTLVMRSGGEVVAVALSVSCKGHLFGHILATDPDLDRFGLGGILVEQTILTALAEGFDALDMLAPADPYKLEWTQDRVGVGDHAFARTLKGRLYLRIWLRGGRDNAKRLAGRLARLIRYRGRHRSQSDANTTP